jgi:redox-sensitive bicupin YhaK (pirin superfamily)
LFYVEARLDAGAKLELTDEYAQRAAYVVSGTIDCDGSSYREGTMLVFRDGKSACVVARTPAHVMLLGGAPLDGPRHVWWNFVSSSPERIERAKADWRNRRFPAVPGDDVEFIPLPEIQ